MPPTFSISLAECRHGCLYRIRSRNLGLGVFNAVDKGFIGIREKFGHLYLFTEYHNEIGPPHGTVWPQEELEKVPADIPIFECGDAIDSHTGRRVSFDKPVSQGGKGWFFLDTGEACEGIQATLPENKALFDYLERKKAELLAT